MRFDLLPDDAIPEPWIEPVLNAFWAIVRQKQESLSYVRLEDIGWYKSLIDDSLDQDDVNAIIELDLAWTSQLIRQHKEEQDRLKAKAQRKR